MQKIASADKGYVVDDTQIGVSLENADMVIFVLSRWSDANSLPDREYFSLYYDDVAAARAAVAKKTYLTETVSGRPFLLVFYNLEANVRIDTKGDIILDVPTPNP